MAFPDKPSKANRFKVCGFLLAHPAKAIRNAVWATDLRGCPDGKLNPVFAIS